ncbi:liver expressed antimicrobial peptide 2, partial [Columba livia]
SIKIQLKLGRFYLGLFLPPPKTGPAVKRQLLCQDALVESDAGRVALHAAAQPGAGGGGAGPGSTGEAHDAVLERSLAQARRSLVQG